MKRWIERMPRNGALRSRLAQLATCILIGTLVGCTYYVPPPTPTVVPGAPASFDRSFAAASGAMRDQGVAVSVEDRSSGRIVGKAGDGTVTANVRQQADGSVRVQFDASGVRDSGLIDRVSRAYDARMGR